MMTEPVGPKATVGTLGAYKSLLLTVGIVMSLPISPPLEGLATC